MRQQADEWIDEALLERAWQGGGRLTGRVGNGDSSGRLVIGMFI